VSNGTLSLLIAYFNFCFLYNNVDNDYNDDDNDDNDNNKMAVAPEGGSSGSRTPIESLSSLLFSTIQFHMNSSAILRND
jgi:hypothetical protein